MTNIHRKRLVSSIDDFSEYNINFQAFPMNKIGHSHIYYKFFPKCHEKNCQQANNIIMHFVIDSNRFVEVNI